MNAITYKPAIEALEAAVEKLHEETHSIKQNAPDFSIGNFKIKMDSYGIRFCHTSVEDVNFQLNDAWNRNEEEFPFKEVLRVSWSSWSYDNDEEHLEKSISYLEAELEKLHIIKNKSYLPVAKEYWTWIKENISPLYEKRYELERSITELKTQEKLIETAEEKAKAIQWFKDNEGKTIYLHDGYYYNSNCYANEFDIGMFKKDKVCVSFYGTNKWYDADKMLQLYKSVIRKVAETKTDYSKHWDDPTRDTYMIYDNLTDETRKFVNYETVSKEEYKKYKK